MPFLIRQGFCLPDLADSPVHRLRCRDTQNTGRLQRVKVHRVHHVHNVRHLACLCAHLLQVSTATIILDRLYSLVISNHVLNAHLGQYGESFAAKDHQHERHHQLERHRHAGLPLFSETLHHHHPPGAQRPSSMSSFLKKKKDFIKYFRLPNNKRIRRKCQEGEGGSPKGVGEGLLWSVESASYMAPTTLFESLENADSRRRRLCRLRGWVGGIMTTICQSIVRKPS